MPLEEYIDTVCSILDIPVSHLCRNIAMKFVGDHTGTSEEPSAIVALAVHTLLALQEQPALPRAVQRQSHGERAGGER